MSIDKLYRLSNQLHKAARRTDGEIKELLELAHVQVMVAVYKTWLKLPEAERERWMRKNSITWPRGFG